MSRHNLQLTPDLEEALDRLMDVRGLATRAEALRLAVCETLEREQREARTCDYTEWIGAGRQAPENPHPRFRSDDDLWG